MKKNNKGFSLVELIVVVLIMAIIAVALAPQVMKWVENSRKSTDCNNYDSVVSAVNIALANESVMKIVGGGSGVTLTWATTGWSLTGDNSSDDIRGAIGNVLGANWYSDMKIKRTTDMTDQFGNSVSSFEIAVDKNGTVSRSHAPSSDSIS